MLPVAGDAWNLPRAAGVGAALFTAVVYGRTGFDRQALADASAENMSYAFGEVPSFPTSPLPTVLLSAGFGASWGVGCRVATRTLPMPEVVAGALYGIVSWTAAERFYRSSPARKQTWMLGTPPWPLAFWSALGATTAALL
jgi:hypothetical protein